MVDKTSFLAHFENYLASLLGKDVSELNAVARYCALDGGKRVRPVCVYLGALAAGGDCEEERLLALAAGVELVHCYSLVHDDLPSMDNAATRRGKPSAHVAFGEANAVLGGDMLLSMAFEHLTKCSASYGAGFAAAASEIAEAAVEMAHGQAMELEGICDKEQYLNMCSKKTGALISGALRAGAIAAGASDEALKKVTDYAKALGLVFQISDDILDADGLVALVGEGEARLELELRLLQAVNAASTLCEELSEFAAQTARRKR